MRKIFHVGDEVNILPYGDVKNHVGICESGWGKWAARNPHVVVEVRFGGGYYTLDGSGYGWPSCGLELAQEDFPPIDDLV